LPVTGSDEKGLTLSVVTGVSSKVLRAWLALVLVVCASCAHPPVKGRVAGAAPPKSVGRPGCGPPIDYQVFKRNAFGADWSKTKNLLAYNAKDTGGAYHIYTVKSDGTDAAQLGAGSASFPQRSTGTPVWSPSGAFIAFVAEKSSHPGSSVTATPGWGSYSDLWVADADGSHAWQLTDVATDRDHGTIIPEFSPDGRLLEWTERTKAAKALDPNRFAGFWAIKVADFNVGPDGTPALSNVRTVSPTGDAFNETGGFSADSSSLVFTSDFETHNFWSNQIYRYDLNSGASTRLTRGNSYNEHPRYTPDGQVLWMTNADNPSHGTDWWTMGPDGSNPQRLSDFNTGDNAKAIGQKRVYATTVQTANWSPDNSSFYGDVETNLLTSDSVIVRAELTCHGS
jgi:Tol biopolymer transport system component